MKTDLVILLFPLLLVLGMVWMTRSAKKAQSRQRAAVEEALVPGAWVITIGGFYGKVVEVDGETVTLESPAGDETLWSKTAIRGAQEPQFAGVQDLTDEAPLDNLTPEVVKEADNPDDTKQAK